MRVEQHNYIGNKGWNLVSNNGVGENANWVLVFGSRELLSDKSKYDELKAKFPNAHLLLGTTAGEIVDTQVIDDSIIATAVHFKHTQLKFAKTNINEEINSYQAGCKLAEALTKKDLAHVFVLSDGQKVNGSELVAGLNAHIPAPIAITGGLAGDGTRFEKTLVGINGPPEEGNIVAIGFYGDRLKVGFGSVGGWDSFGPERLITRAKGNVLYELDGQSALDLYKKYLGDQAAGLPATGLLFPLSIKIQEGSESLVRTILAVDEKEKSMTFAGDMPEGAYACLMKANFDRLIDGAFAAANHSYEKIGSVSPDLAILISCIGRKIVLDQRIEEEVESVREVLGEKTALTGFYSYGEISPFALSAKCELHNQTMTITTMSER